MHLLQCECVCVIVQLAELLLSLTEARSTKLVKLVNLFKFKVVRFRAVVVFWKSKLRALS